jgi:cation transport regulator ChaB
MALDSNSIYNLLISLMYRKILVSGDFHEQSNLVSQMLKLDSTGMVKSLTNFQVECATSDIRVDTDNNTLNETFENWLENINSEFRGQGVEVGIRGLLKEYLKERWQGSSFPVLKITKWGKIDGIHFPISMSFIDGGSVFAEKKSNEDSVDLLDYNYYVGKNKKEQITGKAYFLYKPFGRIFDKYPEPYLIGNGVYKNWKLIDMIKDKEFELIDRVIPYMLLILKGSEALTQQNITYDAPALEGVKEKFQEVMTKLNNLQIDLNGKQNTTPIRVANWDEEIKHLIPDLESMFKTVLFQQAERNILAGLGFIDIAEATSNSRSQSVLNPKPFIKECNSGLSDFANVVLKDLIALIKEKNPDNIKYKAKKWVVCYNPITEFMGDNFLTLIRSLSDRGIVSNETADYICSQGTINYEIQKRQRIREVMDGDEFTMLPKLIQNSEDKSLDFQGDKNKTPEQKTQENIPEDKKGIEAKNFNQSMLDEEDIDDKLVFSEDSELELSRWIKKRAPGKYYRFGQINPNKFVEGSFKTIFLSQPKAIKAVVGKLKSGKNAIQSYLFDKKKWDNISAEKWLKNHLSNMPQESELVISPYSGVADLPSGVRKKLDLENQKKWLSIFNAAYEYYNDKFPNDKKKVEALAFKTAYSKVKKNSFLSSIKEIFGKK